MYGTTIFLIKTIGFAERLATWASKGRAVKMSIVPRAIIDRCLSTMLLCLYIKDAPASGEATVMGAYCLQLYHCWTHNATWKIPQVSRTHTQLRHHVRISQGVTWTYAETLVLPPSGSISALPFPLFGKFCRYIGRCMMSKIGNPPQGSLRYRSIHVCRSTLHTCGDVRGYTKTVCLVGVLNCGALTGLTCDVGLPEWWKEWACDCVQAGVCVK